MTDFPAGGTPRYEANMAVVTPTDRVRWGPVWAGLFIALSTWVLLSVLGAAIGLSAYEPGEAVGAYGTGAAIWGGISAIIAFILGGWWAARTAAVRGESNGLINGVMVWAVGIPLLFLLFGTTMLPALGTRAHDRIGDQARQAAADMGAPIDRTQQPGGPLMTEETARTAHRAAWGTLVSLLLGLGAAALGGYLGARGTESRWTGRREDTTRGGMPPAV